MNQDLSRVESEEPSRVASAIMWRQCILGEELLSNDVFSTERENTE